jgi:hypothetical protein
MFFAAGNKAITASVDCLDIPGSAGVLAEGLANFKHTHFKNGIADKGARPYCVQKLPFRNDTVWIIDQIRQDSERFGAELHPLVRKDNAMVENVQR